MMKRLFVSITAMLIASTQFSFAADEPSAKTKDPCNSKKYAMTCSGNCTRDIDADKFFCFTNCEALSKSQCSNFAHCKVTGNPTKPCVTKYVPRKPD